MQIGIWIEFTHYMQIHILLKISLLIIYVVILNIYGGNMKQKRLLGFILTLMCILIWQLIKCKQKLEKVETGLKIVHILEQNIIKYFK